MPVAEFITENRGGHIGLSSPRADGPLKVAGAARYAAEHNLPGMVYGFPVLSTVAGGRITAIQTEAAERVPGVIAVVTHKNAPEQAPFTESDDMIKKVMGARPVLAIDSIMFHGQFVALVVAETYEAARDAASLVTLELDGAPAMLDFEAAQAAAYKPNVVNGGASPDTAEGDFAKAFAAAPVQVDATYETPYEHHNAMEPHAAVAEWAAHSV